MHIKKILSQHRRDFRATFECEHCGHSYEAAGYDDSHYHNNVIPDLQCPMCFEKAGDDYRPLAPKYPDGVQV